MRKERFESTIFDAPHILLPRVVVEVTLIHMQLIQWPAVAFSSSFQQFGVSSFPDKAGPNSPTSEGWNVWLACEENPSQEIGIGCTRQPAPLPIALPLFLTLDAFQREIPTRNYLIPKRTCVYFEWWAGVRFNVYSALRLYSVPGLVLKNNRYV